MLTRRILIPLLAVLTLSTAHAAETWFNPHKNGFNNAVLNQPAAVTSLTTGSHTWTTPHDGLFANAGAVIAGGTFYTVKQVGGSTLPTTDDAIHILAYNAETGIKIWQSRPLTVGNAVSYWSNATPTYDPTGGVLYFGSGNALHKLDAASGNVITSTPLSAANTKNAATTYEIINSSPVIGGNMIYIESYGDYSASEKQLVAFNKSDLSVAWAVKDGGIGNASPCYVDNGTSQSVYSAFKNGVACYDAKTGLARWKSNALGAKSWVLPHDIAASLVYDGGRLYVTSEGFGGAGAGELICVDALTGDWKWTLPKTIEWVSVPPVVMNGKVYVKGGYAHTLWCFDAATGVEQFSKVLGGGGYASFGNGLAAAGGRLYTTDGQRLLILDAANGNVVTALSDDYYSGLLALDARGALYVHASDTVRAFGQTVPVTLSAFSAE